MKFDFVIGNPPYQENICETTGNKGLATQLFPSFVQESISLGAECVCLITPSRWFTGDAQDKSFVKLRDFFRTNNHIAAIVNYKGVGAVFKNSTLEAVSYFVYKCDYEGLVRFVNIENGVETVENRNLFEEGMNEIIDNSLAYSILSKVKESSDFKSFMEITRGRNAFGIVGRADIVAEISTSEPFEDCLALRCRHKTIRYVSRDKVTKGMDIIDKFKIFISKSTKKPPDPYVNPRPLLAEKVSVCTDSLIPIGNFESRDEAEHLEKYMCSKFLRHMVSVVKSSQNVCQNVYRYVPLQNFTPESDIDWSGTVAEIDRQLYKKYGLTQEEIDFIESTAKEMV